MKKKFLFWLALTVIVILVTTFLVQELGKKHQAPLSNNFPLKLDWSFDSGYRILRPARIANDVVIIHTEKRPLESFFQVTHIALNTDDGAIRWELPLPQHIGWNKELHLSSSEENAFFIGGTRIVAVSLVTGLEPWPSKRYGNDAVISNDEDIFIASSGVISSLDTNTGAEQWSRGGFPRHFVIFYDEKLNLLVIPEREMIYILNADTGEIVQQQPVKKDKEWDSICTNWLESITYHEERIYCGPMAMDLYTGEVISNKNFRYTGSSIWHPLIKDNIMYFSAAQGTIRALDLDTFELLWEFTPFPSDDNHIRIISRVAIIDEVGYAIADNGFLYAFDIATGDEIGWWQSPEGVVDWTKSSSGYTAILGVVSDEEKLYVTFGKKTLYVFENQNGE